MKLSLLVFFIFTLTTGCTTISSKFIKTGEFPAKARASDCEFGVYTVSPDGKAKEVGYLEFHHDMAPSDSETGVPISEIKAATQEKVCAAGGNALLLRSTDKNGSFTSGTVLWIEK